MAYCTKCGNQIDAAAKFCSSCGTPVPTPAPVTPAYTAPAEPVYTVPVAQTYIVPAAPVVSKVSVKAKVLGFVGMGIGIGALFFAIYGLIVTLIGMEETGMGFGMAIAFSLFASLPLGIVGKILSNQSMQSGNTSGACSAGSKLSIAAIIVSGVMLFLGFINLVG